MPISNQTSNINLTLYFCIIMSRDKLLCLLHVHLLSLNAYTKKIVPSTNTTYQRITYLSKYVREFDSVDKRITSITLPILVCLFTLHNIIELLYVTMLIGAMFIILYSFTLIFVTHILFAHKINRYDKRLHIVSYYSIYCRKYSDDCTLLNNFLLFCVYITLKLCNTCIVYINYLMISDSLQCAVNLDVITYRQHESLIIDLLKGCGRSHLKVYLTIITTYIYYIDIMIMGKSFRCKIFHCTILNVTSQLKCYIFPFHIVAYCKKNNHYMLCFTHIYHLYPLISGYNYILAYNITSVMFVTSPITHKCHQVIDACITSILCMWGCMYMLYVYIIINEYVYYGALINLGVFDYTTRVDHISSVCSSVSNFTLYVIMQSTNLYLVLYHYDQQFFSIMSNLFSKVLCMCIKENHMGGRVFHKSNFYPP